MVEVFKTNVDSSDLAMQLVSKLSVHFPQYRINFDLHDCDNILRVEGDSVCNEEIIKMMGSHGFQCHTLD